MPMHGPMHGGMQGPVMMQGSVQGLMQGPMQGFMQGPMGLMPSEPVVLSPAPGGGELRHVSPVPRVLGMPTGGFGEHQQLMHVQSQGPVQGSRLVSVQRSPGRSPGPAKRGHGLVAVGPDGRPLLGPDGRPLAIAASPGAVSQGVLMMPAPGMARRGGPPPGGVPQAPATARGFEPVAVQAPVTLASAPPSAHASYTPPVSSSNAAAGGALSPSSALAPQGSMPTPGAASVPVGGMVSTGSGSPLGTSQSFAAGLARASDAEGLGGGSSGVNFREAVSKVTAKALREYRQNHRVSLSMDRP